MQKQTIKKENFIRPLATPRIMSIDWADREKAGQQISDALEQAILDSEKYGYVSLEELKERLSM